MPFHYTPDAISTALDYVPDTGEFIWKRSYGKRIRPGTPAGSINKDGERVITLFGQTYLAKRLAWLLSYGHWPEYPVTYRSLSTAFTPEARAAARLDLRIANLCLYAPPRVQNSRADYMRRRRAAAAAERTAKAEAEAHVIENYPSIVWSDTHQHWQVREEVSVRRRIAPGREYDIIGTTRDRNKAVEMFNVFTDRCLYVLDNPASDIPDDRADIRTGKGHTLREISAAICYNPETGEFLSRLGKLAGTRIDRPKDGAALESVRVVPFRQDTYYARNLAWFLGYYEWPAPREIVYDNGWNDDCRLENLVRRADKEARERYGVHVTP
jgi:hypothetical protein